jgi:hypothetical protein
MFASKLKEFVKNLNKRFFIKEIENLNQQLLNEKDLLLSKQIREKISILLYQINGTSINQTKSTELIKFIRKFEKRKIDLPYLMKKPLELIESISIFEDDLNDLFNQKKIIHLELRETRTSYLFLIKFENEEKILKFIKHQRGTHYFSKKNLSEFISNDAQKIFNSLNNLPFVQTDLIKKQNRCLFILQKKYFTLSEVIHLLQTEEQILDFIEQILNIVQKADELRISRFDFFTGNIFVEISEKKFFKYLLGDLDIVQNELIRNNRKDAMIVILDVLCFFCKNNRNFINLKPKTFKRDLNYIFKFQKMEYVFCFNYLKKKLEYLNRKIDQEKNSSLIKKLVLSREIVEKILRKN